MRIWLFLTCFGSIGAAVIAAISGLVLELKSFGEPDLSRNETMKRGVLVSHAFGLALLPLLTALLITLFIT